MVDLDFLNAEHARALSLPADDQVMVTLPLVAQIDSQLIPTAREVWRT